MSDLFNQNRRRFPRIKYGCQLTVWRTDGSSDVFLCSTLNIGVGGVCVILNKALLVGSVVDMRIDFTNPSIPFKCRGIIVRCMIETHARVEVGIEFEGLDEVKKSFLEGKISELIDKVDHGTS